MPYKFCSPPGSSNLHDVAHPYYVKYPEHRMMVYLISPCAK